MINEIYNILNSEEILKIALHGVHYINYDTNKPPFLTFNIYKIKPFYYADNKYNYKKYYIQIDIYNKNLKEINELEKIIINKCNNNKFSLEEIKDFHDEDLKCYRKTIRYTKIKKETEE